MRFLLDQDVYAVTARFLRSLGHDVVTAAEIGCSRATDVDLLDTARSQKRLLVTRDRHFGWLVFGREAGSGVIYLRISPINLAEVHDELARVLRLYSEDELAAAFIVVEQGRHRYRRRPNLP